MEGVGGGERETKEKRERGKSSVEWIEYETKAETDKESERERERQKDSEILKLLNCLRLLLSIEPIANKLADQDQPNKMIFLN